MPQALSCLPGSARALLALPLVACILGGCDTAPDVADADPLPPTMSQPTPESAPPTGPVSLRTPAEAEAARGAETIAGEEQGDWRSLDGPVFDWRDESGAASTGTPVAGDDAGEPATPPSAPPSAQPPAPPAPATEEPPAEESGLAALFSWFGGGESEAGTASGSPALSAWELREQQMRGLPGWKINGRVAISSPQESWSAVLRWEQVGDAFHVRLSTPLGQGLVDLRGVPGDVQMRTAEGEVYRAPDAEALLRDVAGMNLPVSGLRYWVLAVSDPASTAGDVDLDSDSLPVMLEQSGWRIEYDRYRITAGVSLPDRLTFAGADIAGRLIITQWDLNEP